MGNTVYDFEVIDIKGNKVALSSFKGKVLLIVNTASKCGFTPQFEGLEALYKKYKDQGLVIIGFPCNQFLNQDPGDNDQILQFCSLKYNVSFPMMSKIKVNGKEADPLYVFLKEQIKGRIKWNFEKFLINKDGDVVKKFSSIDKPEAIEKDIANLFK